LNCAAIIEGPELEKRLIGFQASFGIPFQACRSLRWNLLQGADRASDAGEEAIPLC
jgi:hypothetical protein